MATATFAAGCFWGVQQRFDELPGVIATEAGYAGGTTEHPTYKQVCSGRTGHAESVRVEYDPARVTYEQLLDAFFAMHDPTQLDRQGPDRGTQYRSAIFTHDAEQDAAARAAVRRVDEQGGHRGPVVTQVTTAGAWWPAEDYHQKYYMKHRVWSCPV